MPTQVNVRDRRQLYVREPMNSLRPETGNVGSRERFHVSVFRRVMGVLWTQHRFRPIRVGTLCTSIILGSNMLVIVAVHIVKFVGGEDGMCESRDRAQARSSFEIVTKARLNAHNQL